MKKNSSDLTSIPLFQDNKVFYFRFLSWEHRGQYLCFTDEEQQNMVKRTEYVSVLSCWQQVAIICFIVSVSYHFPLGLVVRPTHAKWNHSMEHWRDKRRYCTLTLWSSGILKEVTMENTRSKTKSVLGSRVIGPWLINHCQLWPYP